MATIFQDGNLILRPVVAERTISRAMPTLALPALRARTVSLAVAFAASLGAAVPGQDSSAVAAAEATVAAPTYRFRNGFWINLHHFLYHEALQKREGAAPSIEDPDWTEAVAFYEAEIIEHDLLFNDGMRSVDTALGRAGDADDLDGLDLEEALRPVLEAAAPHYRAGPWPEHERANAAWLSAVQPLLDEHLIPAGERIAALLERPWPVESIPVELLAYANWAGAYTTNDPPQIRIGTALPRREPPTRAFETLLHESGHITIRRVAELIDAACAERGRRSPRNLWHVILFFTVGEVVRASPATPEDYVPYADDHGLYAGRWARDHRAVVRHWPAYLAGEYGLEEAVLRVIDDLDATGSLAPAEGAGGGD